MLGWLFDYFFNIVFAGRNGRKFVKPGIQTLSVDFNQSGFTHPRRPPQYERKEMLFFNGDPNRPARADQMFLAHKIT